jgi:cell wall-associated NlpC family hydrolase
MPKDEKYNGNYIIQFFAGDTNPSGQPVNSSTLLGMITQPAGDFHVSFNTSQAIFGKSVIATATPQAGPANTSEFSAGSVIDTLLVTSNADTGTDTLRNAIAFANGYDFRKTISFMLPKQNNTILLKTDLPAVTNPVEIDGWNYDSNGNYINNAWIEGTKLGKNQSGFRFETSSTSGSIVRSLAFRSFRRGNAISVKNSGVTIRDNRFHEAQVAIRLINTPGTQLINNTITRSGTGVFASGNQAGSLIDGNQINYSHYAGLRLENATGLAVGQPGTGNDICGTEVYHTNFAAILATGVLTGTRIQGNRILAGSNGIMMRNARGLLVGGSDLTPMVGGNAIARNKGIGLFATGNSAGSVVRYNSIVSNRVNVNIKNARGLQYIAGPQYVSPFRIQLDPRINSWTSDFAARTEQILNNSSPTLANWYQFNYSQQGYGPLSPQLMTATIGQTQGIAPAIDRGPVVYNAPMNQPPDGVDTAYWQLQRLLAAASSLIGSPYQHLHLPQFNPADVPTGNFNWSQVSTNPTLQTSEMLLNNTFNPPVPNPYLAAYGKPTAGIDCTDFASYIYNLALGIQMYSGTPTQITFSLNGQPSGPVAGSVASANVIRPDGSSITPKFIYSENFGKGQYNKPGSLDHIISQLKPGDLLYIGDENSVFHVVMWLGMMGTDSAGNTFPLVISSHDNTPAIFDTAAVDPVTGFPTDGNIQGHLPPPGVQILPFVASNWFYQDFLVAMRVLS